MNDVWSKLEDNAYKNKMPYPDRPRKPIIRSNATPDEFRSHASELEKFDEKMKSYRERVAEYNAVSMSLEKEFKQDLENYYDVSDNPKKELLYSIAWDLGHDNGLNDVANRYSDLVELIR